MEKTFLLTGHADGSEGLRKLKACVSMLFPECGIRIISIGTEGFGNILEAPGLATDEKRGKKNGKAHDGMVISQDTGLW